MTKYALITFKIRIQMQNTIRSISVPRDRAYILCMANNGGNLIIK